MLKNLIKTHSCKRVFTSLGTLNPSLIGQQSGESVHLPPHLSHVAWTHYRIQSIEYPTIPEAGCSLIPTPILLPINFMFILCVLQKKKKNRISNFNFKKNVRISQLTIWYYILPCIIYSIDHDDEILRLIL